MVSLKLLREDSPQDTLPWQALYSRLRVKEIKDWDPFPSYSYDIKILMITLYFMSSSKPSVKADYIAKLFFEYGLDFHSLNGGQNGKRKMLEKNYNPSKNI